ncbi:NlpC/P60 family protein [Flavobacterium sp. WLB]|uniref:C40 family peptidase n=1 Tax=unclassified Flavobacterium TaxID=196869 RepID=UPI0006ABA0C6|nr:MULTISPECIES: C40 family peptidase [unclassified Flavobacterium]KOP40166.1 glycoside hydrolase [Flavobacterium sp. VMW]OWU91447.1 glycoside hydrolase [Flavobacterium sp. NLM]PUU71590.1 NlpC/P60 family protein [Flavobacterium sp. WLB]
MKKILVFLLLSIVLVSCKSTSTAVSKNEPKKENRSIVKNLIETATDNIGVKYKAGGTTKSGFDCSGLVYTTFESENIKLPRSSFEQAKVGKVIPLNDAKKGDLIFFKTNKSKQINHVGLITEVNSDEIKFIHSSTSKGVIISSTKEAYYKNSFEQVNRVIE